MRLLTWNLYHGRADPAAVPDRDLLPAFADLIAGWEWDVALLQECPPWWPVALGRACDASARMALTSRNQLYALRRALGRRRPELMKSSGGCNAILVRGDRIAAHHRLVLRRVPERRVAHAVRLAGSGLWVGNLHAQVHSEERAQADGAKAGAWLGAFAGGAPAVLGGDWNVREPRVPGWVRLGGRKVDHVLGRGVAAAGVTATLERGSLSDHHPLAIPVAVPSPI